MFEAEVALRVGKEVTVIGRASVGSVRVESIWFNEKSVAENCKFIHMRQLHGDNDSSIRWNFN